MGLFTEGRPPSIRSVDTAMSTAATTDLRMQLQALLDEKEKQLQAAGTLGQRILAQQMELEERINQISEIETNGTHTMGLKEDEVESEMRAKLAELAETMHSWESETEQLWSGFKMTVPPSPTAPADSVTEAKDTSVLSATSTGPSAAQSSRRAKNAAHRQNDVEFAFEIGSNLITEVRRLQALLGERDKALQDMKEDKDDLEKSLEALRTALRQQEASADKYKEENWNLEVTVQEIRTQLADAQSSISRLEAETNRTTKQLTSTREQADYHKGEAERLTTQLADAKAKHDTEFAQMRRTNAGLQREKGDLQTTIDNLNAEIAKKARGPLVGRFGSPMTPNDTDGQITAPGTGMMPGEDDPFTSARRPPPSAFEASPAVFPENYYDLSPDPSPSKSIHLAPNHPSKEIEVLRQNLAHAQRQIATLKGTLSRAKKAGAILPTEGEGAEDWEEEDGGISLPVPRPRPAKKGRNLAQALAAARFQKSKSKVTQPMEADGEEEQLEDLEPVDGEAADAPLEEEEEEDEQENYIHPHAGRPASIEGMDPMFANVLRTSRSMSSLPKSPLKQSFVVVPTSPESIRSGSMSPTKPSEQGTPLSPVRRSFAVSPTKRITPIKKHTAGRRARGGAAFRPRSASRPTSLVGATGDLAAELGGLGDELNGLDGEGMHVPGAFEEELLAEVDGEEEEEEEESMATEANETLTAPTKPVVETKEFGCQAYFPEELPPPPPRVDVATDPMSPPPKIRTIDMAVATDTPVKPTLREMDIQTSPDKTPSVLPIPIPIPIPMFKGAEKEETSMDMAASHQTIRPPFARDGATPRQSLVGPQAPFKVGASPYQMPQRARDVFDDAAEDSAGTGGETEYEDAAETIAATSTTDLHSTDFHSAGGSLMPSASVSQSDFQSMASGDYDDALGLRTDDGFDSDSDEQSIVVSRMTTVRPGAPVPGSEVSVTLPFTRPGPPKEMKDQGTDPVVFDEEPVKTVAPVVVPEPEPVKEVKKAELKEMSIQTDEWVPPARPISAVAPVPPSPMFTRVGPGSQQFQFVASPTGAASPGPLAAAIKTASANTRDSVGTFGPGAILRSSRPATATSSILTTTDKSSIVSFDKSSPPLEGAFVEDKARPRVASSVSTIAGLSPPAPVDRSRPPTMTLPPPPRMPPPPPVAGDRKIFNPGSVPVRPTSPPPAELIQRATTPTFGHASSLFVPSTNGRTPSRHTTTPGGPAARQQQSQSSFKSASQDRNHFMVPGPPGSPAISSLDAVAQREYERRRQISAASAGSMMSSRRSTSSRRPSVSSSISSEPHVRVLEPLPRGTRPSTPGGGPSASHSGAGGEATDPAIIHSITQTMIGEFLYKYTRKVVGKGHGEKRHKRFFWVHPYTKTLYWSDADPGSSGVTESTSKSAYIEGVRSVLDPNPMPPGLYQYSVIVSTPQREMKFTAPTKERHDIWFNALKYLLARPAAPSAAATPGNPTTPANLGPAPHTPSTGSHARLPGSEEEPRHDVVGSPKSAHSARSGRTGPGETSWNMTPRAMGQRSQSALSYNQGSIGKRPGTPAAEFLRYSLANMNGSSPGSPTKSGFEPGAQLEYDDEDDENLEFEIHDHEHDHEHDDGYDGLENVRACCDGRHDVGSLSRKPHHHHHHHHHQQQSSSGATATHKSSRGDFSEAARPVSPSAWSFRSGRSKNGSAHDHGEEVGSGRGLFSWKSGESRFGSKRSNKNRPVSPFER